MKPHRMSDITRAALHACRPTAEQVNPALAPHRVRLAAYEADKAAWVAEHPWATATEYQAAMTALAAKHRI
jgi:hypothetical protein